MSRTPAPVADPLFLAVAAVGRASVVARVAARVLSTSGRAAEDSSVLRGAVRLGGEFRRLAPAHRVRLLGVALLVASLTCAALQIVVPAGLAPAFRIPVIGAALATALVLIAAASALGTAWTNRMSGRS